MPLCINLPPSPLRIQKHALTGLTISSSSSCPYYHYENNPKSEIQPQICNTQSQGKINIVHTVLLVLW